MYNNNKPLVFELKFNAVANLYCALP